VVVECRFELFPTVSDILHSQNKLGIEKWLSIFYA